MTLNEDLVRLARGLTTNLSETVEGLLASFVAESEAKEAALQRQIEAHIAHSDAFVAQYGSLGEEFSTL